MYHNYHRYPGLLSRAMSSSPLGGVVSMGIAGALFSGSMAAAKEIRKEKCREEDRCKAIGNVAKESLGGGLAMAAGAAVSRALLFTGPVGLLATLAVGVGVKYLYDGMTADCRCLCPAPADEALPEAAPEEKAKPAKTAKSE